MQQALESTAAAHDGINMLALVLHPPSRCSW